ncbi:MAG: TIGR02556 family CRISPR-associated protein [Atribacterota bacterium]
MLEAVLEIGKYQLKKEGISFDDVLEVFVDNPYRKNSSQNKALVIKFEQKDSELQYKGVSHEDIKQNLKVKYLYIRGDGGRGPNYTPATLISGNIKRVFENRIEPFFKSIKKKRNALYADINEYPLIHTLKKAFVQKKDEILQDLLDSEYNGEGNWMITFKINEKYLGEIKEFINYSKKVRLKKYRDISIKQGVCSLCSNKGEVFGNASPVKFYTLNEPAYIAGGFEKSEGWKNFPLCKKCMLLLTTGWEFIEKNMNYRFAGQRYYLIPRVIINNEKETLENIIEMYLNFNENKIGMESMDKISNDRERDIIDILKEKKDYATFSMLFYEKSNAAFNIKLLVDEIYPSRFKELYTAKNKAENVCYFQEIKKSKNDYMNLEFNFSVLHRFVNDSKRKNYNNLTLNEFYNIIENVIKNRNIDYKFMLTRLLPKIRYNFNNKYNLKIPVLEAMITLKFLTNLGVLNIKGGSKMEDSIIEKYKEYAAIKQFFNENDEFFNSYAKRAIFLSGVLTGLLLKIQYRERNSTPFESKLKGLKLDARDIKGLLPTIQNKLTEYKSNYYKTLEKIISEYFINAGNKWKITNDELNFVFVLGMNLSDSKNEEGKFYFKEQKEDIEND